MANIKSAKKRAEQTEKKRLKNLNRKSAVKTAIKKVMDAIANKESKETTMALLHAAESQMARAKGKGVMHCNTASRKIGRLATRVSAIYSK